MPRIDDTARSQARRKPLPGSAGGRDQSHVMPADSVQVRDGSALSWFWQKLQELRLALAAIEARFGLLPRPAKADPEKPEFERIKVDGFRDIVASPAHAAQTGSHLTLSTVRLQISNRLGDEDKALRKLPIQDREGYNAVRNLVETDAEGRLALQNLLLSGRLDGQTSAGGRSAWYQLGLLTRQDLAPGVDRAKLVGQLLEELADPAKIYQGTNNTCVPAVMAILLARRKPAELVRIVGGLASREGAVRLADGTELRRTPDWQAPDGGRSVGQALFEPALITAAVRPEGLTYDNAADRLSDGGSGLSVDEADTALEALTGREWKQVDFYDNRDPGRIDAALEEVARIAKAGEPVPVGLNWVTSRGHKILVEKIEGDRVHYLNPYGSHEVMSVFELKKRITNVNFPPV